MKTVNHDEMMFSEDIKAKEFLVFMYVDKWISSMMDKLLVFSPIFRRMKKWHGAEIELSMKLCSLTRHSSEMSSTKTRKKHSETEKEKDIKYQNTRIDFFGKRRRALSHRSREFLTRNSFSPHFSCKFTSHTIITHSGSSGNLYICATWLPTLLTTASTNGAQKWH